MKAKKLLSLLLALVMLFALAACNSGETTTDENQDPSGQTNEGDTQTPDEGGAEAMELRFGQINPKAPLDRTVGTYIQTGQITEWVYEGMYRINPETGELEPCLAESYDVSEDGLTYTFHLREGVKFHDGTDFTSADVKYSFERLLTPSTNALIGEDYNMIVGAVEMMNGEATELAGLTCPDDYTVVIETNEVMALTMMFIAPTSIYPEEACSEAGADWGLQLNVIGTGPYKLVENTDTQIIIEKFDEYWGGADAVQVDRVVYMQYNDTATMQLAYQNGDIDSYIIDATQVADFRETIPDEVKSAPTYGHFFTIMNQSMAPFDDIKVREAFAYAIDLEAITNDLLNGTMEPASCLLAPSVMGHEGRDVIQYDPEKAKQMLADAGYPDGVSFEAYTTSLTGQGGQMLVAMQAQAQPAGFTMEIPQVDAATWTEMRNSGQVPFALGNWYLGIPEADGILYGFFHSSNNKYFSVMYENEEYDALVESARLELDTDKRIELYKQADDMLVLEDFVTTPICYPTSFYLVKPYVQNFEMYNTVLPLWDCTVDMSAK